MAFDTLLSFIVHSFLLGAIFPALLKAFGIAITFDRLRKRYRVGRIYFLIILLTICIASSYLVKCLAESSAVLACFSPSAPVRSRSILGRYWDTIYPPPNTSNRLPSFLGTVKSAWFDGVAPKKIIVSVYNFFFELLFSSKLFWGIFVPAYIVQTIYDWAIFIYQDFFLLFKDLGLGGSGRSFYGYALARLRALAANVDVLSPPRIPQTASPYFGRLNVLQKREGVRPTILGVTPQRQVDFPAPPNMQLRLEQLMTEFVNDESEADHIEVRRSFLERGLVALRRRLTIPTDQHGGPANPRAAFGTTDEFGGEIYHVHRDSSSHVTLHPADCRRVLEGGWGERHPFCTESWYWRLYFHWCLGIRLPVPAGLMILYAPRHQECSSPGCWPPCLPRHRFNNIIHSVIVEFAAFHQVSFGLVTSTTNKDLCAPINDCQLVKWVQNEDVGLVLPFHNSYSEIFVDRWENDSFAGVDTQLRVRSLYTADEMEPILQRLPRWTESSFNGIMNSVFWYAKKRNAPFLAKDNQSEPHRSARLDDQSPRYQCPFCYGFDNYIANEAVLETPKDFDDLLQAFQHIFHIHKRVSLSQKIKFLYEETRQCPTIRDAWKTILQEEYDASMAALEKGDLPKRIVDLCEYESPLGDTPNVIPNLGDVHEERIVKNARG
ncbi:hypothetical protein F5Y19DRAFT_489974 [Xylariaceae sp. FL1651]|nr:hypothetical protein F5Y19DRAFT_489974 [Xylariaceae sp. FL1651]